MARFSYFCSAARQFYFTVFLDILWMYLTFWLVFIISFHGFLCPTKLPYNQRRIQETISPGVLVNLEDLGTCWISLVRRPLRSWFRQTTEKLRYLCSPASGSLLQLVHLVHGSIQGIRGTGLSPTKLAAALKLPPPTQLPPLGSDSMETRGRG